MFLAGISDVSLCKPIITLNAIKQKDKKHRYQFGTVFALCSNIIMILIPFSKYVCIQLNNKFRNAILT